MLCFAVWRLAAFRPEGDSLLICGAADLCAAGVLFLACLPLVKLPTVRGRVLSRVTGGIGAAVSAGIFAVMLWEAADSLRYSFPDFYSAPAVIAAAGAGAVYCASMGLRGCARAACAAVVMTLVVLALLMAGAGERFEADRLHLAVRDARGQFGREFLRALVRSGEIPLLVILRGEVKAPGKALAVWLGGRALLSGVVMTFCAGVLGEFSALGIPVDSLSSYSRTSVIERFDALVLLVWVLCTVLGAAGAAAGAIRCGKTALGRTEIAQSDHT